MAEKRKSIRLDKELQVTFERKGPTRTLRGDGITRNVSPGGLCLVIKTPLGVGEKINFTLTLPDTQETLVLEGRVKWTRPQSPGSPLYEVGIELSQESGFNQNKYLLFICTLMYEQFDKKKLI